jgi:hypothetical protein
VSEVLLGEAHGHAALSHRGCKEVTGSAADDRVSAETKAPLSCDGGGFGDRDTTTIRRAF